MGAAQVKRGTVWLDNHRSQSLLRARNLLAGRLPAIHTDYSWTKLPVVLVKLSGIARRLADLECL